MTLAPTDTDTPTSTPIPTATETPTFTSTPTITLTPTTIPSPTPTFDPDLMGTHNRKVIIGENGWMYMNSRLYRNICHNSQEWGPFKAYSDKLDTANQFLEERGVEFAVAFIPEKCHVYSDEVQFLLWDVNGPNATIPLIEYLKTNSDTLVFSYFETLNAHKDTAQVFFKTDNHWSAIGSYLAYRESVVNLLPETDPEEMFIWNYEEDFKIEEWQGDLGKVSGIEHLLVEPAVMPDHDRLFYIDKGANKELIYKNPDAENDLTLVVYHDSFFRVPPVADYLATHFRRTIYLNHNWGLEWSSKPEALEALIEEWDPDIVLVVYMERNIKLFLK
jgi:hypothetical protein